MKALSLWNPWATLLAIGAKRIETRHWPTRFRGSYLIHAAKGDPSAQEIASLWNEPEFQAALNSAGYTSHDQLPQGLIGEAILTDCRRITADGLQPIPSHQNPPRAMPRPRGRIVAPPSVPQSLSASVPPLPLPTGPELQFGDYTPGRFAFITIKAVLFQTPIPIPYPGKQMWFNIPDPKIEALARAALGTL